MSRKGKIVKEVIKNNRGEMLSLYTEAAENSIKNCFRNSKEAVKCQCRLR